MPMNQSAHTFESFDRRPFIAHPWNFTMDTLEAVELKRVTFLETTH